MKPLFGAIALGIVVFCANAGDVRWVNLSSERGELPVPGESTQQTGNLVADLLLAIADPRISYD